MWTRFLQWVRLQVDIHWHRYHLLDLRHQGEYVGGWCDRSHVIFLAAFRALKDFVEEEMTDDGSPVGEGGVVSWDEEPWAHAKSEILDLYRWWVRGRREEWAALDASYEATVAAAGESFDLVPCEDGTDRSRVVFNDDPRWKAYHEALEALEKKDGLQFDRLMAVRNHLWT